MNFLRLVGRNRPRPSSQSEVIARITDDLSSIVTRGRFLGERVSMGPNFVHAYIVRGESGEYGPPGEVVDLGWAKNLKTTVGMDWLHRGAHGLLGFGVTGTVATASSATSLTATGTPFVADAHKGQIVVAEEGTNAPVWGNIGTNSTSVLTVDAWRTGDDTAGTTPGATANYLILPGTAAARYMGLTTDVTAPATSDTTLATEITTGGLARALATFAHTGGATTSTLSKTFAATATHTNVHKGGLFTASTTTAGGILVATTNLNADATLANGDSLAVTWTWTWPAAG